MGYEDLTSTYKSKQMPKGWWSTGLVPQPDAPPKAGQATAAISNDKASAFDSYEAAISSAESWALSNWGTRSVLILHVQFVQLNAGTVRCFLVFGPGQPTVDIPARPTPNPYRYDPDLP